MAEIEKMRAVVNEDEVYDGAIIPSEQASIQRPVRIREDATVKGSVYGTSVSAETNTTIDGSVMADESIEVTDGTIEGEVGTPGKVVCENTHIKGTVCGKRTRLSGCIIRGNVVGTEVILENCIVLGLASADRALTLENTLCYTFRTEDSVSVDEAMTILPQAVIGGELEIESPVQVAGLGELDTDGSAKVPEMTEEDLYEQDGTQYLTLAPRILNLNKIQDRLQELEEEIMTTIDNTDDEDSNAEVANILERLDVDTEQFSDQIERLN